MSDFETENKKNDDGLVASQEPVLGGVKTDEKVNKYAHLKPFLPTDLIGGAIPYIPGTEEEAVWNAATHSLGTERVSYTYTIYDSRIWFLAIPASVLASNPESWCPLTAALPGNSEYWDRDTAYLYEQDGIAAALMWDKETGRMQVFTGAARTILPRVQSMGANFISIDETKAQVYPWKNRALNEERLSRFTAQALIVSGIFVILCALGYWAFINTMTAVIEPDLRVAKEKVQMETVKLIGEASNALQSDSRKHLTNIQQLLDALKDVGGTLTRYEVDKKGKTVWEALVPKAVNASKIGRFNATPQELSSDGRMRVEGRL